MARATQQTDHSSFLTYRRARWAKMGLIIAALCCVLYVAWDAEPVRNGGSPAGYTLGTIGALLIVWLSWLGIRKRRFNPGHWSLKAWTSAHVYLGLALIVIGTLHTGFQFGWNIHTLSYVLMMATILSGVVGLILYSRLPARMSDNRGERSQVEMLEELQSLTDILREAALSLDNAHANTITKLLEPNPLKSGLIARLRGASIRCANRRVLGEFQADARAADPEAQKVLLNVSASLERRGQQLDRIRRHRRYRTLLEIWLWVHIPATIALIAALVAHIIAVFYYQ